MNYMINVDLEAANSAVRTARQRRLDLTRVFTTLLRAAPPSSPQASGPHFSRITR